ncbi:MAG: hypothetical protein HY046_08190 [Acidobacteria bacterium]|nr:hypothetical protein [Acidobacteriota bacterium]
MTRSGSIVYYLAAVVCGCLFMSMAVAAVGEGSIQFSASGLRGFFLLYFLSIVYGWFTAVVFALVLRRMAGLAKFSRAWQWAAAGAVLAPAVVWALSALWTRVLIEVRWPAPAITAAMTTIFFGPVMAVALPRNIWTAAAGGGLTGAATALVLFSIHRAFESGAPE